ncbi:MAG: hypothetical protein AB7D38_11985 [Sulfurimonas sp.]|uniref:hypothetical protein n=1 Tax=Sulfurimonas sp. TaxID=2022749 RepID=UPI003D129D6C
MINPLHINVDILGEELFESAEERRERQKLQKQYGDREVELTPEQQTFLDSKLSSKWWRLDNLYTIKNKDGRLTRFKLNKSQRKVLGQKHKRKLILKARQQGISTLFLAYNLDSCLFIPGYEAGIQSYGQNESDKLAMRAELMWEKLDQEIKDILGLKLVANNQKGMVFSNGSILKIGNFRGDTLQALHVSELGKIAKNYPEKAKELKTGAFQAVGKNNIITIESTAEGAFGDFYDMCQTAMMHRGELTPFDFAFIFLSWLEDNDCTLDIDVELPQDLVDYFNKLKESGIETTKEQRNWYAAKYKELGVFMKQEYPTTPEEAFEQSIEGAYYKDQVDKIFIGSELYDESLKVFSVFDLGISDYMSVLFFQVHSDGSVVIINEYETSGKSLEYIKTVFEGLKETYGWQFGNEFVPHDISVRELSTSKSRYDIMKELGFSPVIVHKHKLMDGIEVTRKFLSECKIDSSCELLLAAIRYYRKSQDRKLKIFLDSPVHDEYSHMADCLRYLAMAVKYKKPSDIYVVRNGYHSKRRKYSAHYGKGTFAI